MSTFTLLAVAILATLYTGLCWRFVWHLACCVRRGGCSEEILDDVDVWGA